MRSTLKMLREEKSYTQKYVGHVLGIRQNTYSKLEKGLIRLTTDRVNQLADLYGVDPDIIMKGESPVVNFNNGTFSKGAVHADKYFESGFHADTEKILALKDKIIEEKDKQILMLKEQVAEKNNEICFWRNFVSK